MVVAVVTSNEPDAVVSSPDNRLMVSKEVALTWSQQSKNKDFEGWYKVEILAVQEAGRQRIVTRYLLDQVFRKALPLLGLRGCYKPGTPQPGNIVGGSVVAPFHKSLRPGRQRIIAQ